MRQTIVPGVIADTKKGIIIPTTSSFWEMEPDRAIRFLLRAKEHLPRLAKYEYAQYFIKYTMEIDSIYPDLLTDDPYLIESLEYVAQVERFVQIGSDEHVKHSDDVFGTGLEQDWEIQTAQRIIKAWRKYLKKVPPDRIIGSALRQLILKRDRYYCRYCGQKHEKNRLHIDHVLPYSRGGKTTEDNLVTACVKCNLRKHARTPEEAGYTIVPLCELSDE